MISRGIAAFLGGFAVLNFIGNLLAPGFDANIWWIDFSSLPGPLTVLFLLLGATALLVYAIKPPQRALLQWTCLLPIAILAVVTLLNAIRFYRLLQHHRIATSVPLPFSAIVFAALALMGWGLMRSSRSRSRAESTPDLAAVAPIGPHFQSRSVSARSERSSEFVSPAGTEMTRFNRRGGAYGPSVRPGRHGPALIVAVVATCIVAFPLAQMYFFGHTDYRRRADVIVVFGARAHADGSPSGVLADRVRTGCDLYHRGLAPQLIFSGGPGDGAITEPQAMRRLALQLGVPDAAILLDENGVNTDATVRNTIPLFRNAHLHRVLAVSHSYHLARIKMAYLQAGWNIYTVPSREDSGLPGRGRFLIFRELIALGAYYLHPLRRS